MIQWQILLAPPRKESDNIRLFARLHPFAPASSTSLQKPNRLLFFIYHLSRKLFMSLQNVPISSVRAVATHRESLILKHLLLQARMDPDAPFYFKWTWSWDADEKLELQDVIETRLQLKAWGKKLKARRAQVSRVELLRLGFCADSGWRICLAAGLGDSGHAVDVFRQLAQLVLSEIYSQPMSMNGMLKFGRHTNLSDFLILRSR